MNVGLEDAKLAAADSVDEVVSTDCVLMKDASGNPVKILKEDFNEAVRDALGSILSSTELGASIGRVAALGSSDNDFGSISTSDLASVLGVELGKYSGASAQQQYQIPDLKSNRKAYLRMIASRSGPTET